MQKINSSEDLFQHIKKMDKDNSVVQFIIPGKGKFTIVLEEELSTINSDIQEDEELGRMIHESQVNYKEGRILTTSELIKSLSPNDFKNDE